MKRIIAVIILALLCFLAGCDLFAPEQEQKLEKSYESIRVDTNPSEPMLYSFSMSDNWYRNDCVVVDENWNVVFAEAESASYLIDALKPTGTPESVIGMRIETIDEEGNIQTKIVDKTGRQLGGLDDYNIDYRVKNGHVVVYYYYYEGDYIRYNAGLYDIENETIVIPEQMCTDMMIVDEELVYIRNDDGCRFVDYSGDTVCELPGITYVDAYNYNGGGVLAASNLQDYYWYCNGLVDLDGNWLTETSYKYVSSEFFGEYTVATKYALEYGEYGVECVLLDRSGTEYELDIPPTNDWYDYNVMQEFAIVSAGGDGTYIIKPDRSAEKISDGWVSAIALGDVALIETEEGVIVTDPKGSELNFMEGVGIGGYMSFSDKYFFLYDRNTKTVDLYAGTANGMEKLDISDVQEVTPDGRFFVCRNSSATGLKDIDGNWVYKDYLFNYLAD